MIMGFAESGQGKEVLGVFACVKDDGIISDGLLELRNCGEEEEEGHLFFLFCNLPTSTKLRLRPYHNVYFL